MWPRPLEDPKMGILFSLWDPKNIYKPKVSEFDTFFPCCSLIFDLQAQTFVMDT